MDLVGKRVVVMGLGRFGGGLGAARFAIGQGADVLITDLASADQLAGSLTHLKGLSVEYRLGRHVVGDFVRADLIVVNPAVDLRHNRYLQAAQAAGVATTSEIRMLVQRLPQRGRTIGVTGTVGKSTVTAMIGHVLGRCAGEHSVHVGGNLGGSLLESLGRIKDDDWVVLELSSFMLEDLGGDKWSPHIAVVTNLAENHLDRHHSYAAYVAAKQNIFAHQTEGDCAVLLRRYRRAFQLGDWRKPDRILCFAQTPYRYLRTPLSVPGQHNRMNAVLALGAAHFTGVDCRQAQQAIASFAGLPHRLHLVAERAAVRYVDDSKSTTPQATRTALASFDTGIVHAILGGYDKAAPLEELGRAAMVRCRAIYTVGATGDAIALASQGGSAEVVACGTLDKAVAAAVERVRPGDVVLLSPGCASWDQFDNYQKRGEAFIEAVLKYTGDGAIDQE